VMMMLLPLVLLMLLMLLKQMLNAIAMLLLQCCCVVGPQGRVGPRPPADPSVQGSLLRARTELREASPGARVPWKSEKWRGVVTHASTVHIRQANTLSDHPELTRVVRALCRQRSVSLIPSHN
jgi:hypothetical protein